jgi:hypothetical protein
MSQFDVHYNVQTLLCRDKIPFALHVACETNWYNLHEYIVDEENRQLKNKRMIE